MTIKFESFADAGDLEKERVVMKAVTDTDIGQFALLRTLVNSAGNPTTGVTNAFWFPDKPINAGDLVVLYTKVGTPSEKALDSGKRAHFLYWGLSSSLWRNKTVAAVLLHVDEWSSKAPPAAEQRKSAS